MQHGSSRKNRFNNHYPFGSIVESRSWKGNYRYGFNGQEGDDEVSESGNSYTAEYWQYDSRLGRRWNVDPVYKNSSSNYSVFSNKPIVMVDPLGNSDYYTKRGKYLGSDGTSNTDIMVVTKFSVVAKMWWNNRKALRNGAYALYEKTVDIKDYFLLPPEAHREQIKVHFDDYDPSKEFEIGGKGVRFEDHEGNQHYEHFRVKDGEVPVNGKVAEIGYKDIHIHDDYKKSKVARSAHVEYYWHTHTKIKRWIVINHEHVDLDKYKNDNPGVNTIGGAIKTTGGPGPSTDDIKIAENQNRPNNFVLYKREQNSTNGNVTFYGKERTLTSMSLRFFLSTKAKAPEKSTNGAN